MNTMYKNIILALIGAILFVGCAPQALFFNVDVKGREGRDIDFSVGQAGVFAIVSENTRDSARAVSVGMGLAEKIETDREINSGDIPVFSLPYNEFSGFSQTKTNEEKESDKEYLKGLMLKSGCDIQVMISNLMFENYTINKQATLINEEMVGVSITIPYMVDVNIYNTLEDSLIYTKHIADSIYLQIMKISPNENKIRSTIAANMPELSKKIGENIGTYLTVQWETCERMLINYEDQSSWSRGCALAQDFKWKEAIELWLPYTSSENPKKVAYAAYNIAVACEMMEQFKLASEWITLSQKKYKFREAEDLRIHLKKFAKQ